MSVTIEERPSRPNPVAIEETGRSRDPRDWAPNERINKRSSIPFILLHFLPLLAFVTGVTWRAVTLCVVLYVVRMLAITGGYHRYFSHRSYKLGARAAVRARVRRHERRAEGSAVVGGASPQRTTSTPTPTATSTRPSAGFWWSHVGWILCDKYNKTETDAIKDFAKYPELVWLDKHDWVAPWTLGFACYLIAGWSGLIIGFFLSTVLLWHGTFTINSLAHVWGRRVYDTTDTSRNNAALAVITGGEGWHNNHHRYPWAARQGFRWWQIDMTYYVIRVFSWLGIVHDIRPVPAAVRAEARRLPTGV